MSKSAPPKAKSPRSEGTLDEGGHSARGGDTRQRLISVAEKLFGEHGLHGVTLRDINKAAGQRNESALHYHFGSKHALIMAIMRQRSSVVDERRAVLVDELEKAGKTGDMHAILSAMLLPMVEMLDRPEGVQFVRFMSQVINDPDYDMSEIARRSELSGLVRAMAMLAKNLEHLPPAVAAFRSRSLIEQTVMSLAIWSRHEAETSTAQSRALLGANLIDAIHGFLLAPVSPTTENLLP